MSIAVAAYLALAALQPAASSDLTISVEDFGPKRYQIVATGSRFTSRDAVEARLLIEAARKTIGSGHAKFALVEMPGESTGAALRRPTPAYGEKYRNWHVEWSFRAGKERWQHWRPQSGAAFWADTVDMSRITQFEASAIVEAGPEFTTESADIFDAAQVLSDLVVVKREEG
jgi:hypothetical protein